MIVDSPSVRGLACALAVTLVMVLFTASGSGRAMAASSIEASEPGEDSRILEARIAIDAERYDEATRLLRSVIAGDDTDANAHNLLGFSLRKSGDASGALAHYQRALALEPEHLGANAYLGELYLEQGEIEKARERLAVIKSASACFFGCDEYDELEAAIERHAKRG